MERVYYKTEYISPIGPIMIVAEGERIRGLWLQGQQYFASTLAGTVKRKDDCPVLVMAKRWLDRYFAGEKPEIDELPLAPEGSEFRREVWNMLCEIPYGETVTYGSIARAIAEKHGKKSMSAQAVGGAVGHNPISIIIPCHRVVGSDGSMTGYAGGIDKKIWLLEHEQNA